MDHIHVCDASVAPCDDPEDQLVLTTGTERSSCVVGTQGLTL